MILRQATQPNAPRLPSAAEFGSRPRPRPGRPNAAGRAGERAWRAILGCRRATAAVEFAVASLPMLLLLFGFITTNTMFYTWSVMQNNAQYAALMISAGKVTSFTTGGLNCSTNPASTTVEYYACGGLPGWASYNATVTENCAVPNVSVTISTSASTAGLANVYALFTGQTLSTQATTMKQGNCP